MKNNKKHKLDLFKPPSNERFSYTHLKGGERMRKLSTIQKRENLNTVYAIDEAGCGGASHAYRITPNGGEYPSQDIQFQNGPRNSEDSIHGVLATLEAFKSVADNLKQIGVEYTMYAIL